MTTAVIQPDASGTFVGSSFMYATARDWARFGLLYAQDGVWKGKRILPENWVNYSRTPAAPKSGYGAQFWLKVPLYFRKEGCDPVILPEDTFHAVGYQGQFVTIIPSRKLVIVRLGLTQLKGAWDHDVFVAGILAAVSKETAPR
jgi:CubicO group peptidase (beta-lactamase class C family)